MSPPLNDGGPAFPVPDSYYPHGGIRHGFNGMSLRDWFAGEAMKALIAAFPENSAPAIARLAFAQADAMLAERAKGGVPD